MNFKKIIEKRINHPAYARCTERLQQALRLRSGQYYHITPDFGPLSSERIYELLVQRNVPHGTAHMMAHRNKFCWTLYTPEEVLDTIEAIPEIQKAHLIMCDVVDPSLEKELEEELAPQRVTSLMDHPSYDDPVRQIPEVRREIDALSDPEYTQDKDMVAPFEDDYYENDDERRDDDYDGYDDYEIEDNWEILQADDRQADETLVFLEPPPYQDDV